LGSSEIGIAMATAIRVNVLIRNCNPGALRLDLNLNLSKISLALVSTSAQSIFTKLNNSIITTSLKAIAVNSFISNRMLTQKSFNLGKFGE
jgi:hypothetical protein